MGPRYFAKNKKGNAPMRLILAALFGLVSLVFPTSASAESADVEAIIEDVDTDNLSLKLNDGKKYLAPEEFNFDGLQKGVRVIVFYTEIDGKRVINDLEILP